MYDIVERLHAEGKVTTEPLTSVRLKLHVRCQWRCSFCHMEGNHNSRPIHADAELATALEGFRDYLGFSEAHLTGGEPMIHPEVRAITQLATGLGFTVKMTTNGQVPAARYLELVGAGLKQVNVSVHTLDGAMLAAIMRPTRSAVWGDRAVTRQLSLLHELQGKVVCRVNTVVGTTIEQALSIASFVFSHGIDWRITNSLEDGEESLHAIHRLCDELGAEPVGADFINGSSSYSVTFQTSAGGRFRVKLIRPFRLSVMCTTDIHISP